MHTFRQTDQQTNTQTNTNQKHTSKHKSKPHKQTNKTNNRGGRKRDWDKTNHTCFLREDFWQGCNKTQARGDRGRHLRLGEIGQPLQVTLMALNDQPLAVISHLTGTTIQTLSECYSRPTCVWCCGADSHSECSSLGTGRATILCFLSGSDRVVLEVLQ